MSISVHMFISAHMFVSVNIVKYRPYLLNMCQYVKIFAYCEYLSISVYISPVSVHIFVYLCISVHICAYLFISKNLIFRKKNLIFQKTKNLVLNLFSEKAGLYAPQNFKIPLSTPGIDPRTFLVCATALTIALSPAARARYLLWNPCDDFNYRPIVDIVAHKKSVYRCF